MAKSAGQPADLQASLEPASGGDRQREYIVVARRYRPQTFDELIGQEHVARALTGAIAANRVGHAYLFTGARGVGKTSAARILAKALECERGPTPTPCNACDTCASISAGSDVDVLEIDGASNRGIDEIRQLRQNVNIRPSRARFKIYIIDEVHMLTREAFNALLKTLEEPPEHVKFIFCTTEPTKIPITILSRCQRFDFAGIDLRAIVERLQQIVAAEGVTAEPEALAVLARRANGSMRDSQSLLEQLLAFGGQRITTADVHAMLGTAGEAGLSQLVGHLVERNAAAAVADLDAALGQGVDIGQLTEQLLGYFRDLMAAAVGCSNDVFLHTSSAEHQRLIELGKQLGLETVLAIMQILDHTLSRLRYSTQSRTLAEMALVRIAKLENVEELSQVIAELRGAAPPATSRTPPGNTGSLQAAKKKGDVTDSPAASPSAIPSNDAGNGAPAAQVSLNEETVASVWQMALTRLGDLLADYASACESVAIFAPNRLVATFRGKYTFNKDFCERPEQAVRLERALAELTGSPVRVQFALLEEEIATARPPERPISQRQRMAEMAEHPMVRRAGDLFKAQLVRVDEAEQGSR